MWWILATSVLLLAAVSYLALVIFMANEIRRDYAPRHRHLTGKRT